MFVYKTFTPTRLEDTPEVHISSSIEDAVSFISKDPSIHRVFVIGGSTIYQVGGFYLFMVLLNLVTQSLILAQTGSL